MCDNHDNIPYRKKIDNGLFKLVCLCIRSTDNCNRLLVLNVGLYHQLIKNRHDADRTKYREKIEMKLAIIPLRLMCCS